MVLLCSSFSKDISPNYRVGWVAPGKYGAALERLKMVSTINTATLPQLTIAQFLAQGGYDHHLRKIRKAYAQKVTAMADAIARSFPQGTRVSVPSGGFVLWVQLPEGVDTLTLYQRALQQRITLAPGSLFSATSFYTHYIRLNAAFWSTKTAPALERLARLASQMVTASRPRKRSWWSSRKLAP
jgi:DNA-binding transcriptional MocR family regulator